MHVPGPERGDEEPGRGFPGGRAEDAAAAHRAGLVGPQDVSAVGGRLATARTCLMCEWTGGGGNPAISPFFFGAVYRTV